MKQFAEYFIVEGKHVLCRKCKHVYCEETEDALAFCISYEADPRSLGHSFDSADNKDWCILESYCPGCGTMVSARVAPRGSKPEGEIQFLPQNGTS